MQIIDMETWPRKEVYDYYAGISCPYYVCAFNLDVTRIYEFAKENQISFYLAIIFLFTESINEIEAYRYGIRDGQVLLTDGRDALFTDLKQGSEQFHCTIMPRGGSIIERCREAKEASLAQTTFMPAEIPEFHIIFSCLPWMEITALTNEHEMKADDCGEDTNLLIEWGRFREENGRKIINFSVDVNHRFIDGFSLGKLAQKMEEKIAAL